MFDYLSHIVEQSMGIATSVQPLIAPIFAPTSFSSFLSLGDMMPQPADSAAIEEAEAPTTASPALPEILATLPPPALIKGVEPQSLRDTGDMGRDKPLTGAINGLLRMEEPLSRSLPKAERQSEQPAVQPLQREQAPPSQALPIPLSPWEKMPGSDNALAQQASLVEQPRAEINLNRPVFLPEGLFTQRDQPIVAPILIPTTPEPPAITPLQPVVQPDQSVSLHGKEAIMPDLSSLPSGQSLRVSEGLASEAGLPVSTSSVSDQSITVSRQSAVSPSPLPNQPVPVIPSVPPQPEFIRRSNGSVQEALATAKTDEVTVADHVPSPRKQPSRDSYPLDALVQQQSAFYPSPLLPGEISPPASQPGEENRRYVVGATGNERAPFAVLAEGGELLIRQNTQWQLLVHGYNDNLTSEPGEEQGLLTRSAPRDNGEHASEPLIRVSIGRVEVRTTTPPAAPVMKRAAATTPALSLSDYLKRRKGGSS